MSHRHIRYGDRINANKPKGSRRHVATAPPCGLNEINSTTTMVCDRPAMIAEVSRRVAFLATACQQDAHPNEPEDPYAFAHPDRRAREGHEKPGRAHDTNGAMELPGQPTVPAMSDSSWRQ